MGEGVGGEGKAEWQKGRTNQHTLVAFSEHGLTATIGHSLFLVQHPLEYSDPYITGRGKEGEGRGRHCQQCFLLSMLSDGPQGLSITWSVTP